MDYMKILMLNAPFLKLFSRPQRSPAVTKSGTLYYPIWLAYATGVLEDAGHDVKLVDAPADGYDLTHVLDLAKHFKPHLTVLDTSTPSIYNDVKVAEAIKNIVPTTFITLVGTHVSALPEESLNLSDKIDAVARREYDYTLRDLSHVLATGGGLASVEGLSYRKDGQIVHNQDRPYIKDLDALPFVGRTIKKHLNYKKYFNPNALYPMITIITGRGCPYGCIFCVYPQTLQGRGYRQRSVANVVQEFEYIVREFPGVKAVFIEDDTFTANKKRCAEFSEEIIRKGIRISWTANARADADYETLRLMKKAGCRCLCVGFESGDQGVLNQMHKGIRLPDAGRFVEDAKKAGILVHGCFMVGNPGDTRETLKRTLELAKSLNPDTAQFYPIMPYPGTEGYQWAKESGFLRTTDYSKWLTEEGLHNCVISTSELSSEDLVRFCDYARRAFYLRPGYVASKCWQMLSHPKEIRRLVKAARTAVKYLMRGSFPQRKSI
jgi:radical SAM superfamily enzyme YgiQ (UPF0313 family)